jgi:alkanesulfonate monooxygenase SsuD/methylene tetrahydromethanopterin reductase-like flavin-dependent oxidoreductase (luciferase family)
MGNRRRAPPQVADTIGLLRELDGDRRTPVLVAAGGPKARALAATVADIVALAAGPFATREEVAATAIDLREQAGDRPTTSSWAMNLFVVGEQVPPAMAIILGADPADPADPGELAMLRGGVGEMVDELQRRRDVFGVSYISVNAAFLEQFAPVVERLDGR